jgi:hypothetical protein
VNIRFNAVALSFFYIPRCNKICGPLDAVSDCPLGETQIAAASSIVLTSALPLSGPIKSKVVESASEAVAVFAITLTENSVLEGVAVSGSTICPAELLPRKLGVCSEVETLSLRSMT